MVFQILALKKAIGISNTNWYVKYQLVLQIPTIGISNTNWCFKYQLVYKLLFEVMSVLLLNMSNDPTTRTRTTTTTTTTKWKLEPR
jgi:hypothetical protein